MNFQKVHHPQADYQSDGCACLTSRRRAIALRDMTDTLDTLKQLLAHQYEATLSTLNLAIARCPDAMWNQPVAKWKFCQAAFHTVFFGDVYLQPTDDVEA